MRKAEAETSARKQMIILQTIKERFLYLSINESGHLLNAKECLVVVQFENQARIER